MIRHISVFFLKAQTSEAEAKMLLDELKNVGDRLESISGYHVGRDCMQRPSGDIPGLPEFGHIAQMIDFETKEAAENYPVHPAHLHLMKVAGPYIEKVVGIDFEV